MMKKLFVLLILSAFVLGDVAVTSADVIIPRWDREQDSAPSPRPPRRPWAPLIPQSTQQDSSPAPPVQKQEPAVKPPVQKPQTEQQVQPAPGVRKSPRRWWRLFGIVAATMAVAGTGLAYVARGRQED